LYKEGPCSSVPQLRRQIGSAKRRKKPGSPFVNKSNFVKEERGGTVPDQSDVRERGKENRSQSQRPRLESLAERKDTEEKETPVAVPRKAPWAWKNAPIRRLLE